jgi:hypothetical protein
MDMPSGFTKKQERQYEHIKESEKKEEGRSEKDAERIAAATVNKEKGRDQGAEGREVGLPSAFQPSHIPSSAATF